MVRWLCAPLMLGAMLLCGGTTADGYGYGCGWCGPCYPCYPCYPCCWYCCQPDTTPFNPQPAHPPTGGADTKLTFSNGSGSDFFVSVSILWPWGVYKEYDRVPVPAGATKQAPVNSPYKVGDNLLIETWFRLTPTGCWYCRCRTLLTLPATPTVFDVVNCAPAATVMAAASAPATIVVTLPADASLTIDGYVTKSTSSRRVLVTPELKTGRDYTYTLKAQIRREGRVQEVARQVTVRGGRETTIELQPTEAVARR